ncbi:MAG TPA: hypothetical protein VFI43_03190 [Nitrosospira sp.]|nr:hypothetical protein [Nitrosospira sp.]
MKFSSISTMRPSASALILAGTMLLGVHGIANAQSGNSGQAKENPADYSDKKDPIEGRTGEYKGSSNGSSGDKNKAGSSQRGQKDKYGVPQVKEDTEMGSVDQQKRAERNKDPRSPSPDSHVPDFPTDKQGRPLKDLSKEQGGPIGPN